MEAKKQSVKCSECDYFSGFRPLGNTRTEFTCIHSDQDYIKNYFHEKEYKKCPVSSDSGQGIRTLSLSRRRLHGALRKRGQK